MADDEKPKYPGAPRDSIHPILPSKPSASDVQDILNRASNSLGDQLGAIPLPHPAPHPPAGIFDEDIEAVKAIGRLNSEAARRLESSSEELRKATAEGAREQMSASRPQAPRKSFFQHMREGMEITDVRSAADYHDEKPTPEVREWHFWSYVDKAVLSLFEMLALLFGLPLGDALYHEKPVTNLHLVYLAIGALFAIGGPMFPLIRAINWLPKGIAQSVSSAARDARVWIAVLLLFFSYGIAPEIYQRALAPSVPAQNSQQQMDEKIAAAVTNLNAQLNEAKRERDIARRDADTLRKQIQNTPTPPRPNYDQPRVYTNKTIADLRGFYNGRTALQGNAFMADEIGKWIKTQGTINFIRPDGLVFLDGGGGIISCEFAPSWNQKLSAFRPGEIMKVVGKIGTGQVGVSPIYLRPCELDD